MVKTPRTRHSKQHRQPVTIELDPGEVSRVADGDSAAAGAQAPEGAEAQEAEPATQAGPELRQPEDATAADTAVSPAQQAASHSAYGYDFDPQPEKATASQQPGDGMESAAS